MFGTPGRSPNKRNRSAPDVLALGGVLKSSPPTPKRGTPLNCGTHQNAGQRMRLALGLDTDQGGMGDAAAGVVGANGYSGRDRLPPTPPRSSPTKRWVRATDIEHSCHPARDHIQVNPTWRSAAVPPARAVPTDDIPQLRTPTTSPLHISQIPNLLLHPPTSSPISSPTPTPAPAVQTIVDCRSKWIGGQLDVDDSGMTKQQDREGSGQDRTSKRKNRLKPISLRSRLTMARKRAGKII